MIETKKRKKMRHLAIMRVNTWRRPSRNQAVESKVEEDKEEGREEEEEEEEGGGGGGEEEEEEEEEEDRTGEREKRILNTEFW